MLKHILKKHLFFTTFGTLFALSTLAVMQVRAVVQFDACSADINQSGFVDINDYTILTRNFFLSNPDNPRADINQSGFVDIQDYSILVSYFFQNCTPTNPTAGPTGSTSRFETENMTKGGPYAGVSTSPFQGVTLYGNGDFVQTNSTFSSVPGAYAINIRGASNGSNAAGVSIYVGSQRVGTASFTSATPTTQTVSFSLTTVPNPSVIKLILENDNGSSDTLLDYIEVSYQGPAPTPLPTPSLPTQGAVGTGQYRNMFREIGKSDSEIQSKLNGAWDSLFYGPNDGNVGNSENKSVYKTVGSDMAFIEDISNGDIRTEGMSYGMMIAVQMNKKQEFDRLWKFAKTYMKCPRASQCQAGTGLDGYFSWQMRNTAPYAAIDQNPAPDGEEFYATALLFASGRWGNNGTFNYRADAQNLLDAMLDDTRDQGVNAMFDPEKKVIVFSPMGQSALYSDPSYHLPAFYEVWARYDQRSENRTIWQQVAQKSRVYWRTASGFNTGRTNGLMPDCTNLDGVPTNGCAGGAKYAYDSWRSIANVAVDYAWWAQDSWEVTQVNNFQNFFGPKRPSYDNQWNLDGTSASGQQNSAGQISMNGVASLAGNNQYSTGFVQDVWNLPIPKGQYRYYDGMLYMMAIQHLSGNFKMYAPQ